MMRRWTDERTAAGHTSTAPRGWRDPPEPDLSIRVEPRGFLPSFGLPNGERGRGRPFGKLNDSSRRGLRDGVHATDAARMDAYLDGCLLCWYATEAHAILHSHTNQVSLLQEKIVLQLEIFISWNYGLWKTF